MHEMTINHRDQKHKNSKSGKEGLFAPPPHTTKQAGPHLAVPADDS